MPNEATRANVGDVAGLMARSAALFPDVAPSSVALWLLATRAGRLTEAFTRDVLVDVGLDNTEFSVLVVLVLNPEPHRTTLRELADSLVLSQPGATRALQRCESSGYVRKLADPDDGRATIVELTNAGKGVAESAMKLLLVRFQDRLGQAFSTALAITVAAASAEYAVALDRE